MKIKEQKETGIILNPGRIYDVNEILKLFKNLSGNIFFDFTSKGQIPVISIIEREETESEKDKRENLEKETLKEKEKQEKSQYEILKKKYEKA